MKIPIEEIFQVCHYNVIGHFLGFFLQQSWQFEVDDTFGTRSCLLLFGGALVVLSCLVVVAVCILSHTIGWNSGSICSYHLSALIVVATFEPIFGF